MRLYRRPLVWLLMMSMIFTLVLPAFTAQAEEGDLMLRSLAYTTPSLLPGGNWAFPLHPMPNGALVPRTLIHFYVIFDAPLDADSVNRSVRVTDSSGVDVSSQFQFSIENELEDDVSNHALVVAPQEDLKRDEHYTVTIRSGADGLVSPWGAKLPADLVVSFHADGQLLFNEAHFTSLQGWIPDLAEFPFHAAQGPGEFDASGMGYGGQVKLVIRDADTKQVVVEQTQTHNVLPIHFTLPKEGVYLAAILHTYQQWDPQYGFKFSANELDLLDQKFPEVYFRNRNLNYINDKMDLADYLTYEGDWSDVESMSLWLDGKQIVENLATATGLTPYTLDARELSDGMHKLHVVTKIKSSKNIGTAVLEFMSVYKIKFTDVSLNYFGYSAINNMTRRNLLNGTSATTFEPERNVSRKEFATMLHKAFDVVQQAEAPFPFADVKGDDWSRPFVADLAALDWVTGEVQDGQRVFFPERSISRAEALAMIGRALQLDPNTYVEAPAFQDWKSVPDWARTAVAHLTRNGNVHGFPDNTFRPQKNLSRGEAAVILNQFVKK